MEEIKINGKIIDLEAIVSQGLERSVQSEYEANTRQIIKSWLLGQHEFAFKTSGSTGMPKSCVFSRDQVKNSAHRSLDFFGLKPGDTVLCCLNTEFVAGFMMIIRALIGQLNLVIIDPVSDPWKNLEDSINFTAVTPIQIESGLRDHPEKISMIGKLLVGGAAIHPLLERQLGALPVHVYHSYAMTETLTHIAMREVGSESISNIYSALEGVTFSTDAENCLIIHDAILGLKELRTNDVIELLNAKSFRWLGRIDNIVNSGGIKIQIEQLEASISELLVKHGINSNFCIVSKDDQVLTNKVVLLLENNELSFEALEIRSILKFGLPRYHCPTEVKLVPEIFLTKSGKVDRLKNTNHYLHS